MAENIQSQEGLKEELKTVRVETDIKMKQARLIDIIAIVLGVGTVFILWALQWMGLY